MASTLEILKSEIGRLLGLDGTTSGSGATAEYAPFLTGDGLKGMRIYPVNKAFQLGNDYKMGSPAAYVEYFDDFLGPVLSTARWTALTGSDGSNSPVINLQQGGVVRFTTGAGSTHTMAVNGSQLVSSRNLLVSNGGVRADFRLGKASAITSQQYCFGLIDAVTLTAPFTRTTATTTANGTNGACFLQDPASTNTHLYAVAVNAGGSPQSVALNVDIDTAAQHVYRIEIDAAGNATYFIDGALVATIALAVATTAQLAMSIGTFSEATSGSQTLDADYVLGQQLRV